MISEARLLESNVLRNLQQASEARGMKFYVNPPREVVPEFLEDFRPDAMAIGPEGGVIIEVKLRGSPATEGKLAAIAKRVSSQKGWEFRAIYLNPPMDALPPIEKPSPEQLQAVFKEIEGLTSGGHPAAAFATGWAALESLARLASADPKTKMSRVFSPIQAVQTLAENGYIDNEPADRLREMIKLRNAVVHGDFSVKVTAEQVADLRQQLRTIAASIMSVATE